MASLTNFLTGTRGFLTGTQGEGLNGYIMAMDYLIKYLNERDN